VLGILGVTTLGRLIRDFRVADRYDETISFVLLGAALVGRLEGQALCRR